MRIILREICESKSGTKINKFVVDMNETAREHELAEADANADPVKLQDQLG